MNNSRVIVTGFAALALMMTSACVTDPNTGQKRVSGVAIGAGAGAVGGFLFGGLVGGGAGRVLGAGIGALAGAAIGTDQDRRTRTLKEQTTGEGVDVQPARGDANMEAQGSPRANQGTQDTTRGY